MLAGRTLMREMKQKEKTGGTVEIKEEKKSE
jgi:hypothetical protein